MNRRGPRTEPWGTPQVSGYDWDDDSDVLTENLERARREIGLNPEEMCLLRMREEEPVTTL